MWFLIDSNVAVDVKIRAQNKCTTGKWNVTVKMSREQFYAFNVHFVSSLKEAQYMYLESM